MHKFRKIVNIIAILLAAAVFYFHPQKAEAIEGEWTAGGAPIFDIMPHWNAVGPGGELFARYAISDGFRLSADFQASAMLNIGKQPQPTFGLYKIRLGVLYALDILTFIPFAGIHLTGVFSELPLFEWNYGSLGLDLDIGFEYRRWRTFSLGFQFSYHILFADIRRLPDFMTFGFFFAWNSDPF